MCNNYLDMNPNQPEKSQPAFLLAQLGAHAASQFAERMKVLDLAPSDAGILRLLRIAAGLSQQELAFRLKIHPSRLVAILDNLEKRRIVERRSNSEDRRLYSLYLTEAGGRTLQQIGQVAHQHQDALLEALNQEERATLAALLQKVADQQGLSRGVHPGYQRLGKPRSGETREAPNHRTEPAAKESEAQPLERAVVVGTEDPSGV